MIKRATETAQGMFLGTGNTAIAEFFVLAVFCTAVMTLFTRS